MLVLAGANDDASFLACAAPMFLRSRAKKIPCIATAPSPSVAAMLQRFGFVVRETFAFHSQLITFLVRPHDA